MKQTLIISLLILGVAAFIAEKMDALQWMIEQDRKKFEEYFSNKAGDV